MDYRPLGHTDIRVSSICLGTMTWGEQNTEEEAFAQLDAALAAGVNFVDTAEMYPVPPRAPTYGQTEHILGRWLRQRGQRDRLVIATKVAGRADWLPYLRNGTPCLDRKNIERALEDSLRRLQTDYVDLYQLHWPDRSTNFFGKLGYRHEAHTPTVPLAETLGVVADLVRTGKVRHVGLSNETPWGAMTCLHLAKTHDLPRPVSIQNPYSLLNRTFEVGLAEIAHREQLGLLAYSPLGFGVLSGKYLDNGRPKNARLTLFDRFKRYTNPQASAATAQYVEIAQRHGLNPAQMALAFVQRQPFVTSTIIGATTAEQLQANLQSAELVLTEAVLADIEAIHTRQPNPAP